MKLLLLAAMLAVAQAPPPTAMVDVGGHKLNVQVAGTAKPGVPAVNFESGLGSPLNLWGAVPSEIAATTRTGGLRAGRHRRVGARPGPRSVKQIVAGLHALLAKVDVPPPYVLVGLRLEGRRREDRVPA